MEPPPPPPPPHGSNANAQGGRSGGLPDGRYDIFVIPPHSSGSGFLYLPSLQTQRNSFLAGVFCTAATFFIYTTAVPVVKEWLMTTINSGGGGVFMLICGVAVVAWAFGKTQSEWAQPGEPSRGPNAGSGAGGNSGARTGYTDGGSAYTHSQAPPPPPPNPGAHAPPPPHSSWQRPPPQANSKANTTNAKSSWEKAREETRKKEEERKRAEELKKRREELEKERQKQRDKDALERLERERKEKKEREEREAATAAEKAKQQQQTQRPKQESPKRPPMPSARTEREDDAYSFHPYDRPKQTHKANSAASMYSESTYQPSESTAKTSPPPSQRGPYTTKNPDKIIIKGVFSFNNAFMRTPVAQLISGQGNVTDGLILRITTEGLFIDDDVRGVPQREWDVKAWTMKLAEVWCPRLPPGPKSSTPRRKFSLAFGADSRQATSPSPSDSADFVNKLMESCAASCKLVQTSRFPGHASRRSLSTDSPTSECTDEASIQSCELSGIHVLRASIRDQEGKKYVFILSQSEGWKVAVGLQRLRRGSQVRAMGVAGLPQNEAKAILENLGFA
jgi:hypothetical protein